MDSDCRDVRTTMKEAEQVPDKFSSLRFYSFWNSLPSSIVLIYHDTSAHYYDMTIRTASDTFIRAIAGLLLLSHAALVVLDAVHTHHQCSHPLQVQVSAPNGHSHSHLHHEDDCPLHSFFANPVPLTLLSAEGTAMSAQRGIPCISSDADIAAPRTLHPQLRAPPVA